MSFSSFGAPQSHAAIHQAGRTSPGGGRQALRAGCWRALKKFHFWAAKMSHSALEERAARRLTKGAPWTDRRAGSGAKRCSPERGEAMHEVSKRVLFRALLKGGMSKSAISRELGISRRTATRWAAADGAGRGSEALTYGPRAAVPSVLDAYQEIVRVRLSEYPDLSSERLFRELRESGYQGGYDVVNWLGNRNFLARLRRAAASSDWSLLIVKGGRAPLSHFPPGHAGVKPSGFAAMSFSSFGAPQSHAAIHPAGRTNPEGVVRRFALAFRSAARAARRARSGRGWGRGTRLPAAPGSGIATSSPTSGGLRQVPIGHC